MFDVGGQRLQRKKWIHCFERCVYSFCLLSPSSFLLFSGLLMDIALAALCDSAAGLGPPVAGLIRSVYIVDPGAVRCMHGDDLRGEVRRGLEMGMGTGDGAVRVWIRDDGVGWAGRGCALAGLADVRWRRGREKSERVVRMGGAVSCVASSAERQDGRGRVFGHRSTHPLRAPAAVGRGVARRS